MQTDDALSALTALSHPSRLSAFRVLVQAGKGGMAVGELREILDLPPATLSAHLNVLRAAGLVRDQREGRVIRLHAGYERMQALVDYLMENCCGGEANCAPVACAPAKARGKPAKKASAPRKAANKTTSKTTSKSTSKAKGTRK